MSESMTSLLEQRAAKIARARAILEKAKADGGRGLSDSETREYDGLMSEADSLYNRAFSSENVAALAARVNADSPRVIRESDTVAAHREDRCADIVSGWNVPYVHEARSQRLSLGRIVGALAFGPRAGSLTDLERRVMSEGVDSAGGYTVPDILAANFIDRVRNQMRVVRAGAVTVPMASDTLNIARLESGVSPAWKAESASLTFNDLTLGRVQFVAKTLPIGVKLSVELSEDSLNVHEIIERELSAALALELDRAALRGSGVGSEPKGIRSQAGVTIQEMGAGNGDTPADYDFLIDAMGAVWEANGEPTARIYSARTAKTLAKFADSTGQPLAAPEAVAKIPEMVTNQIPGNLVIGASNDCSEAYVGDFRELLIGVRTSLRLEVSRYAGDAFEKMEVWVRAYLRADIQLAHPALFTVVTGIRP